MSRSGYLKDEEFIRGNIPMTKEEVRNLSIIKLGLQEDSVLYDVGAGTGSISIVAALTSGCRVYAFEKTEEAVELIKKNAEKFEVENLITVVPGMAPKSFYESSYDEEMPVETSLEAPTHVFIGGSTGKLFEIIDACVKNTKGITFVANAISLETIGEFNEIPKRYGNQIKDFELVQIGVSRAKKMGDYHMMMGENPVMICSFTMES